MGLQHAVGQSVAEAAISRFLVLILFILHVVLSFCFVIALALIVCDIDLPIKHVNYTIVHGIPVNARLEN